MISLHVTRAGAAMVNGIYAPKSPTELPVGFVKTCDEMGWESKRMWERLAVPKENKTWWLKDDDSYIYYNFGDGRWWIDGPDGKGVYVVKDFEKTDKPPEKGWMPLTNVDGPAPEVVVITEDESEL